MRGDIRIAEWLCVSILAAPPVAHAQQSGKVWRVGLMATLTSVPAMRKVIFAPLISALRDLGYEEGRNIAWELRSAEGHLDRLPDIAAELVALPVDVFICPVCGAPLDAAMHATKTIPIVVTACDDDMVEIGVVASVAHPGGNVTGMSKINPELTAKRLELLKEIAPGASQVAVIWDPKFSSYLADWRELRSRASEAGNAPSIGGARKSMSIASAPTTPRRYSGSVTKAPESRCSVSQSRPSRKGSAPRGDGQAASRGGRLPRQRG